MKKKEKIGAPKKSAKRAAALNRPKNFYTLSEKHSRMAKIAAMVSLPLVPAIGATGVVAFLCNAFGIEQSAVLLLPFGLAVIFAVMSLSGKLFLGGAVLLAGAAGAWAAMSGNLSVRLLMALKTLTDTMVARLSAAGFNAFSPFDFGISGSSGQPERDLGLALALVAVLLTTVFSVCTMKKVRVLPPLLICAVLFGYVFVYNLSTSAIPFALVICFLAALIAKKLCAKLPEEESDEKAKLIPAGRAMAATSSLAALLLTAVVAIPASLSITKPAPVIELIDRPMQYARAIVSSFIMGDVPSVLELGFSGYMGTFTDRTTEASDRYFTGEEIMTVESGIPHTLYMKSWSGVDYKENAWKAASADQLTHYRELFEAYENFTPERLMYNFFSLIDPSMVSMSSIFSARDFSEHGYITSFVDVKPTEISGNLLFLPTFRDPVNGPYVIGSRDDRLYEGAVMPYFDGITTTDWTNFDRGIRYAAYLPTMRSAAYEKTFERDLLYVETLREVMEDAVRAENGYGDQIIEGGIARLDYMFGEEGLPSDYSYLEEAFAGMTDEEKLEAVKEHVTLFDLYDEWVAESYLSPGDEDISYLLPHMNAINERMGMGGDIRISASDGEGHAVGGSIRIESDSSAKRNEIYYTTSLGGIRYVANESRHDLAMAVIDYVSELCAYTLTPREATQEGYSALRIFLDDTREGYCVQYATAAVLLLRAYGVPCRYAEGYLASNFARNEAEDRNNYYKATVRDYDAHAWVEVYIDGYGWRAYEATPPYMDAFYAVDEAVSSGGTVTEREEEVTTPIEEEIIEEEEEEEVGFSLPSAETMITLGVILLVLLMITLPFIFAYRRNERRKLLLDEIRNAPLTRDRLRTAAADCMELTLTSLGALGLTRGGSELPMDFAVRCDASLAGMEFSSGVSTVCVMEYFEKECFGSGLTREELRICGSFAERISAFAWERAGFFKKIYLRLIKRAL
ncbi:MAG: transglutaminase domain-containing protein [Clostridia bacterium]|nr:transglutaminase domain-containing protein [Clostridia bacterium]